MSLGRPMAPLILTDDERAQLQSWASRPTSAQRLALRARIVLACADGRGNKEVAKSLRVTPHTVGKWRARFVQDRLEGLTDEPRPGAPRSLSDAKVEEVITRTLETKPEDATHWSTRGMAQQVGLSQSAIVRIWHAFGLQPHKSETFKLSTDPFFIEKVRDIVGLYLNPPNGPSSFRWTRSPRCKPWTAPNRCCPWVRARPSGTPTTTSATAPPHCSLP